MRLVIIIALILMMGSPSARAISTEKNYTTKTTVSGTVDLNAQPSDSPNRTIADYIKNYVDVPAGATDWKVFSKTKEVNVEGKTKDGYDYQFFKPKFTDEVRKLNEQEVTVKGFMFPLGETDKQNLFLFGPFPVSCPFHYHVSPSLVIEVHADKTPIKFSYDAVTIKGRLQLVDVDPENSTFYKLVDARLVK